MTPPTEIASTKATVWTVAAIVVTLSVAILAPFAARLSAAEEPEELLQQAVAPYQQGRYADAEPLCQRALAILEKVRGPAHPQVAEILTFLAVLYRNEGRYADAEPLLKRALAIEEKALGPNDSQVAGCLNALALLYKAEGRYGEAEPLLKRALAIDEKALGPSDPAVANTLNNLAHIFELEGRYAEAEPLSKRALAIQEKALGPSDPAVASTLNTLAEVYEDEGQYADAEPLFKRVLSIVEKSDHTEVAAALGNLAALYQHEGRYAEAEPLYKRALSICEKTLGPNHPNVAAPLNNLALLYEVEGRYADAEPLQKRALAILEKALGPEHSHVATGVNNLAELYRIEGRYADAEPLFKRALAITGKALGPNHPDVANRLNNLAELYQSEGRYADADPLLRRALVIWEKALGPEHPNVALNLNNLAFVYQIEGRYADAEPLYKRALAINEKALGAEHPEVAMSLNNLAFIYRIDGRYADAEPLYKRALTIKEKKLGPNHPGVANSLGGLALVYEEEGRYADAERLQKRALAIKEHAFGPDHPDVAGCLNDLALLYGAEGKAAPAREAFERARKITLDVERGNQALDEKTLASLVGSGTQYLPNYVALLATIAREPKLDSTLPPAEAEALAFVVAEQARSTMAQSALTKAALRAASGDPATADLTRKVQDLGNQRAKIEKQLDAEYAKPANQQKADQLTSLQQQARDLAAQLAAASGKFEKACPRCAELTAPEPITPSSTQKLLRPGEALVSYFTLGDRVLAWTVRPGATISYRDLPIKRAELIAMVARIRASLLPDRPYDVADAYALDNVLLEPFKADLAGVKNLILVPDAALLPVPFAALVTSDQGSDYAALADAYRKGLAPSPEELTRQYPSIAWLAKEPFALSELPSATSLRALRGLPGVGALPAAPREPFIGIGDPMLGGKGTNRGGAMLAARGASPVDDIRMLPRLPGTREELVADAKALGADPNSALLLGVEATKPKVMKLNRERIAGTRVVAFATHALIGGEIKGLIEPALVLTPPNQPSENDDGLLALDDVMLLKLKNTEWVVLSACNTAAPGGSGEGFSGLVRAFFYAGTPSLLVSQWSVDDAATDQLMTALFTAYGQGAKVSRAAALHDAMLKLVDLSRTDPAHTYFAHPFAWAPFIVVGEGGSVR